MITGINHINLSVSNIDVSFNFYRNIIGLKPLCKWPHGAYLLAGNDWFCLNRCEEQLGPPNGNYTHYAFSVEKRDFEEMKKKLAAAGVKPFKENKSEGESFYFLDPDGHQLEIHVGDHNTRLEYKKKNPWPETEFFI